MITLAFIYIVVGVFFAAVSILSVLDASNPRRLVKAPRIMGKYYGSILDLLVARGFASPREPVRVNKLTRIAILLRYAFI